MTKYCLGVVSKEHVQIGVCSGIAQVCHGKKGSLSKMKAGDWLIYYSPRQSLQSSESCKSFTAIGKIKTGQIYQFEMSPEFIPYRLDVEYLPCKEVPITSLNGQLEFTNNPHWGFILRRGLIELTESDFKIISNAMIKS